MSDDREMQAAATDAVAKAEAAATRRRWINLGEFVAVAGLIIAAVSLWLSWHDRKADEADRQAEQSAAAGDKARYDVRASVRSRRDIVLTPDDRHPLGDIAVRFPSELGVGVQANATPTIPAGWYEAALLHATDGGADRQTGKLPILLTVNYADGDDQRTTTGVFDIVWQTHGRIGRGRALDIVALRRHERGGSQARIDALWQTERPAN